MPFQYISVISLIICTAASYIFLFKSPFKAWYTNILRFGIIFIGSLPVIARNYCLVLLLMVLLAWTYNDRRKKPLLYGAFIFLMEQTHVIMAGFVIMLTVVSPGETLLIKEERTRFPNYIPLVFGAASIALFVSQLAAGSSLLTFGEGARSAI